MRAPPLADNWKPTLPDADRARYASAWNSFRSCRDCKYWLYDEEDGDGQGVCGHPKIRFGAFMTPEDYTCDLVEPKQTQTDH